MKACVLVIFLLGSLMRQLLSLPLPNRITPVILASRESDVIDAAYAIQETSLKVLDLIDSSVSKLWSWTTHHRQLIKAIMGGILCIYGGSFQTTILLFQALSVSGLHNVIDNLQDLGGHYRNARNVLTQLDPEIKKAKVELLDGVLALEKLAVEIGKAKADPDKFAEMSSLQVAYGMNEGLALYR